MTLQERLLVYEELETKKGIRFALDYLRRLWQRGAFPKPIKLSDRKFAWRESTIDAWIASRERAGKD